MKLHQFTKIALLIGGGFLFNYLFWDENLGINLIIFSMFLVFLGLLNSRDLLTSKGILVSLGGIVLTGIMVIYHHSFAARFVHILSLLVFIGYLCAPKINVIYHALVAALLNAIGLPKSITHDLFHEHKNYEKFRRRIRWLKLIAIPLFIFWLFYLIFYNSNPVFAGYSDKIWGSLGEVLASLFEDISIPWMVQLLFGMAVVGLIIFRTQNNSLVEYENKHGDDIERSKKPRFQIFIFKKPTFISLKNEYRSALLLIGSINGLLLIVNAIDIQWIWFNFEYDGATNLSQLVHEGTYLLILSILLSMGILLYFFRRNLNFFPNNVWLRNLANIWIFQNAILVISVVIRNYHYMYHFGLAYKRIGVMFFLAAVIVGLITLYFKINKAKTTFYLLRVNSWAVYGLLLIMSSVNWDMVIVKHNIKYTQEKNMDVSFLLSLSDKTLPVIYENRHRLNLQGYNQYNSRSNGETLEMRIEAFMEKSKDRSWKSWNYCDARTYEYFNTPDRK